MYLVHEIQVIDLSYVHTLLVLSVLFPNQTWAYTLVCRKKIINLMCIALKASVAFIAGGRKESKLSLFLEDPHSSKAFKEWLQRQSGCGPWDVCDQF